MSGPLKSAVCTTKPGWMVNEVETYTAFSPHTTGYYVNNFLPWFCSKCISEKFLLDLITIAAARPIPCAAADNTITFPSRRPMVHFSCVCDQDKQTNKNSVLSSNNRFIWWQGLSFLNIRKISCLAFIKYLQMCSWKITFPESLKERILNVDKPFINSNREHFVKKTPVLKEMPS